MPWNPEQYQKFQSERSAPFYDLLSLVEIRPSLAGIDLGCGSGELTRVLAETLPFSKITGLDSSPQMLEKAAPYANESLRFIRGNLASLEGSWDLIFSNAALQWVNDHHSLIRFIFSKLAPGGQLCVQVPSNHHHISHQLILKTARMDRFRTILQGFERISPVLDVEGYANLLYELGALKIQVFEKVYPHVLADADAVVEWISGTALVPYFERLGTHKKEFITTLTAEMEKALPGSPLFYPFRRILFSAFKANGT